MQRSHELQRNASLSGRLFTAPGSSVLLTGLAVAFSLFGDMTMYTVLPVHFAVLGLTPMEVGILLSANRWIRIVTNPLAAAVTRRFPPRVLVIGSLLAGAGVTAVYGLAPPFLFFLAARLVWGMCWSFLRQIGVMNAVGSAAVDRVGRMIGIYNGSVWVGSLVGNLASGLLFDAIGYRPVFLLMAGLSLVGVIPAMLGTKGRRLVKPMEERFRIIEGKSEDLLINLRGFLVGTVGSGIVMSTLGHVLNERLPGGLPLGGLVIGIATINGLLLAVRYMMQVVGSPFLGVLIDRIGVFRSQFLLFAAATAALAAAFLRIPTAALVALVVVFFLSETALQLGLMIQAGMRGSKRYARLATAMDLGSAVGPVAGWTAVGLLFSSRWAFLMGAACYLLGLLFTLISIMKRNTETETAPNKRPS